MTHPLIPIDKLLSEAWLASKAHWRSTLKLTVAIAVLSSAVGLLQNIMNAVGGNYLLVAIISVLLSLAVVIVVSILSYALLRDLVRKELKPARVPEFWPGFLRIALAGFLQFLVMAAIVLAGVIVGGAAMWLSRGEYSFIGTIFVIIASVGIVALSIWTSIKLSFTGTALIAHDLKSVEALKASWNLVTGRWWAVCGRGIVVALVLAAVGMVIGLGTLIVMAIVIGLGALVMHGADMPSIAAIAEMGPSGLWTSTGLFLMAGAIVVALLVLAIRIPFTIFQLLYGMSAHLSLFRSLDATKGHAPALEEKT